MYGRATGADGPSLRQFLKQAPSKKRVWVLVAHGSFLLRIIPLPQLPTVAEGNNFFHWIYRHNKLHKSYALDCAPWFYQYPQDFKPPDLAVIPLYFKVLRFISHFIVPFSYHRSFLGAVNETLYFWPLYFPNAKTAAWSATPCLGDNG